jgi:hypothetical protein
MSYLKNPSLLISILLVAVGLAFISAWLNVSGSISYADLTTALTTTIATFGTLLGIITAGLMFTQGTFSELTSELTEKSPEYLSKVLSLEKIQSIETHLLALRKTFKQLATATSIAEERNHYERIVSKASLMFVNFAVLMNLKLKQQGLSDADLLVSEMDSNLYQVYQRRRRSIRKEWQILNIIKQTVDLWEGSTTFFVEKSSKISALETDLRSSISILKLKENVDKSSKGMGNDITKTLGDLNSRISELGKQLHKDRIPQLLSQMEQANTLRGRYFYLALVFIATPLLVDLLILPQLSQATATFFKPIILVTSLLSIVGVVFLFLYIYKILNV